jgi:hypothetical protein
MSGDDDEIEALKRKVFDSLTARWPARCRCGKQYSEAQWTRLQLVGRESVDDEPLELRVCLCGSTISVRSYASK